MSSPSSSNVSTTPVNTYGITREMLLDPNANHLELARLANKRYKEEKRAEQDAAFARLQMVLGDEIFESGDSVIGIVSGKKE